MKRTGWFAVGVILLGMLAAQPLLVEPGVQFNDMDEAWRAIEKLNYICCSDRPDGLHANGFMVSKEKATWRHASELCKSGPMDARWTGKVWIMWLAHKMAPSSTLDDAGSRVWGRLFVYGDPAFLDELESSLVR